MDQRLAPFIRKFKSAQRCLSVGGIQDITSLKYRDDCASSSEYSHFIDRHLRHALGLDVVRTEGDFWGPAWLVTDEQGSRVILVEHETGLEILYVTGSIASLVALIPLIASGWNKLRDRFHRREVDGGRREVVEIRRFSQTNVLAERQSSNVEVHLLGEILSDYAFLKQRVQDLETEVRNLKRAGTVNNRRRIASSGRKRRKGGQRDRARTDHPPL
jgi:hypothetical protein